MASRFGHGLIIVTTLLLYIAHQSSCEDGATESEILVNFKSSLTNASALSNWDLTNSKSPCKWVGVRCNGESVGVLRLENMGLAGLIDIDTLVALPLLRSLSLTNNNFQGRMPAVSKLSSLKFLYLSYNNFSGHIPDDAFSGMNSLKKLYMARNNFTGQIPTSLATLGRLVELVLQGNQFEGNIPDFQHKFEVLDLSNNHLEGPIPSALSDSSPASSFADNKDLCGKPMQPCKSNNNKKRTIIIIIVVAVSSVALLVVISSYHFGGRCRNQEAAAQAKLDHNKMQFANESQSTEYPAQTQKAQTGKLHFARNDRERFELQDLLRASAEALGSGSFGSSYKASLISGPTMVVKRLRQMRNVGKEEFQEHIKRLGMLSHPNLLPLVAFYFRKEEKLLVFDFIENGSLASHLHRQSHNPNPHPRLDWPTRLKIIKGVARALAYLFKQFPNTALPHGHLKSSNILLDHTFEPLLTDYALFPVVNRDLAQQVMVAYKSPDEKKTRKTDVWSLGILILEMLTGKYPENYLKQGNEDLGTWVNSVVREEWTGEVFDKEMKGTKNGEGEMLKLLKIGMCCCEWNAEKRWDLREAVEKIEELKDREVDYDDISSYGSEGDVYSSRAMTDDDFSFSVNGS